MFAQISHTFKVDFGHFERSLLSQEVLCEHAHARPDFENGQVGTSVYGVGNGACHTQIFQKVLSKEFFRAY